MSITIPEPQAAPAAGTTALVRLMTWLSPAFPVGAFAFSHGLEHAVHDGLVTDRDGLIGWLSDLVTIGSLWNDAVLFAEAGRRSGDGDLAGLCDLAAALAGSRERLAETLEQGAAFLAAARAWPNPVLDRLPAPCPWPVAAGAVVGAHRIDAETALAAWLNAVLTNLVQAGTRLLPLGQSGAVAAQAALEPVVLETAARAARSTLDDLGAMTVIADIASLRHETQHSRLFRS